MKKLIPAIIAFAALVLVYTAIIIQCDSLPPTEAEWMQRTHDETPAPAARAYGMDIPLTKPDDYKH